MKKIKWSNMKKVPGTKGKFWTTTLNFTYTPPTETEIKIGKVERALKVMRSLRTFTLGVSAGGNLENVGLEYDTPGVLKGLINRNEERLRELKNQDQEEKAAAKKVTKKKKS